jgi:hypothetical protein
MARLLGAFLRFHLNLRLAGREIAMEIIEERTTG